MPPCAMPSGGSGRGLLVPIAVSALSFALAETAPGSRVDALRLNPRISPSTLAAIRDRYGLYGLEQIPSGEVLLLAPIGLAA